MNNDEKMLDAVRAMQKAARIFNGSVEDLSVILIEQIGSHAVVSSDFVLPRKWCVKNCGAATEWANTQYPSKAWVNMEYIGNNLNEMGTVSGFNGKREGTEEITRDQFIQHVYNPWKAQQEKPNYDISNVTDSLIFEMGDQVEVKGAGIKGTVIARTLDEKFYVVKTSLGTSNYSAKNLTKIDPPKFDPAKADKAKMYFAVHERHGEGVVFNDKDGWQFGTIGGHYSPVEDCTHIDHEPIQRRN